VKVVGVPASKGALYQCGSGLSPQCGFASTEVGNVPAEDQQWTTLAMIVDISKEVWR
jgi:hypothetical protein